MQKPKGTVDLLPDQIGVWQHVEAVASEIFSRYGYKEMRTPIFENYELFHRSVGENTDIVSKEMYDFYDKGDRHIALKPEGTASIVRAYVEHKLYGPEHSKPYKVYYNTPCFRYERPQSGRQRQFHQLGVECFGVNDPAIDVEVIAMALNFLETLGLKNLKLAINSLGDSISRKSYREALVAYLTPYKEHLSEDSQRRLVTNPLRILDSKAPCDQEIIRQAPEILNYLSDDSRARFRETLRLLDKLDIHYEVDSSLVRGLDYYQETIFEVTANEDVFNGELTVLGGGNYTGLVEEISTGKDKSNGFGFGLGIERLIILLEERGLAKTDLPPLDFYIVEITSEAKAVAIELMMKLRYQGYRVERDFLNRKPKKQFKEAHKLHARYVLTLGPDELKAQEVTIKDMESGDEKLFPLAIAFTKMHEIIKR